MGLSLNDLLSSATTGAIDVPVSGFDQKVSVYLFSYADTKEMHDEESNDNLPKWTIKCLKGFESEPTKEEIEKISRKLSIKQMTEIISAANGVETVTEAGKP